jgi:hypothetical protein
MEKRVKEITFLLTSATLAFGASLHSVLLVKAGSALFALLPSPTDLSHPNNFKEEGNPMADPLRYSDA